MDINMCKSFTAIEMIDSKTGNTVASIQGTSYFGQILTYARINLDGYTIISGLGTKWFIATHYLLVSTIESIHRGIDRIMKMHPKAEIRVTEQGKQFMDELKISISKYE